MKKNAILFSAVLLMAATASAQAPAATSARTANGLTPLPAAVSTLVFDDCDATIVADSVDGYEAGTKGKGVAVSRDGSQLTFREQDNAVRLHLGPGSVTRIVAKGGSEVTLQGSFRLPGTIEFVGGGTSTISLLGDGDTMDVDHLVVTLDDAAHLNAHSRLQVKAYDITVKDYSRMKAFELAATEGADNHSIKNVGNGTWHCAHRLSPGEQAAYGPEEREVFWNDDIDLDDITDLDSETLSRIVRKVRIRRGTWNANVDFAWGFHNWGGRRLDGMSGTDGDAAVRTSFNHILLTVNYPVLHSRHVALYAGLGMEWDKYKFHRGDVHFDLTAEPYHLYNGGVANSESRLLTRYVILPLEVKLALGRHWRLGVAAIPGLHWSGSHTGLRRDIVSGDDEVDVRDYSVNNHIAPYKLDARLTLQYHSIGIYFQAAMLSAFKSGCDELFPVKFGIIL